jgi:hypothetical protein
MADIFPAKFGNLIAYFPLFRKLTKLRVNYPKSQRLIYQKAVYVLKFCL